MTARKKTVTLEDGSTYTGEFKNKIIHGKGTFTLSDGEKYVGEFKDGKQHGKGTFTTPSGYKYVGQFRNSKYHGKGTETFEDIKYIGEWENDKRHGKGTLTFPDGEKYVGEFKDGEQHGKGTLTSRHGKKIKGEWKNDQPIKNNSVQYVDEGLNIDKNPTSTFSFEEKSIRKAVGFCFLHGFIGGIIFFIINGREEASILFGVIFTVISFISGLVYYKSLNILGLFLPSTIFIINLIFYDVKDQYGGDEVIFSLLFSMVICLVTSFAVGIVMNWIDQGK